MHDGAKPDLIIGIDLGQTCTGVAFCLPADGNDTIRWIQKWPGRAQANENKVPTILAYPAGHDRPSSWGFKAESAFEQTHGTIREWFKTLLDPKNLERQKVLYPADTTTHEEVRHWYRDYLTALYEHVKLRLSAELPNFEWSAAHVELLWSVPTTWTPQIVELFRKIIGQAGFGGPANASHTVTISLTEPEAAAVHTSTVAPGIFKEDDVLVVCDAGGGTTDLSVLQVTDTMIGSLSLKQLRQLDVVSGQNIGSAAIDVEFERLARRRLEEANEGSPLELDVDEIAWEMSRGRDFQNTKCEHGAPDETPTFTVAVPRLRYEYASTASRIENGTISFDIEELRALFDHQIEKLFKLVDGQLLSLSERMPHKTVSHLVLSGGLGQSPYVQRRLREHYAEVSLLLPNARNMRVRVAPDPQMAVSKGLVADRLRKLKAGESVLGWRCCRASYGLICKELYNKKNPKHIGRHAVKDPKDRELYVPDCVDWFVEKGTPVSIDKPIVHDFRRKISPGDPRRMFPTKVVVSYKEKDSLPYQLEDGVEKLCEVESDLSGISESQFREKNKQFWKTERYFEVVYQVKVVIGPADLSFELWFNGQKLSKQNAIKVEWAASTAPSTAALRAPPTPALIEEDGVLKPQKPTWKLQRMFSASQAFTPI